MLPLIEEWLNKDGRGQRCARRGEVGAARRDGMGLQRQTCGRLGEQMNLLRGCSPLDRIGLLREAF